MDEIISPRKRGILSISLSIAKQPKKGENREISEASEYFGQISRRGINLQERRSKAIRSIAIAIYLEVGSSKFDSQKADLLGGPPRSIPSPAAATASTWPVESAAAAAAAAVPKRPATSKKSAAAAQG